MGLMFSLGARHVWADDGVVVGSSPVAGTRGDWDGSDSHGWVVIDGDTSLLRQMKSWLIVQLPPRRAIRSNGVSRGSVDGSVRQVLPATQEHPVALAAWGDELYVISETNSIFPQAQRQVGSIRVVPTGVGEYWAARPTHRLQARAALGGGGEILGAVGTAAGPMVLVVREGSAGNPPGVWLRVLHEEAWREMVLPDDLRQTVEREGRLPTNMPSGGRWWRLVATKAGVEVWTCEYGSNRARVWGLADGSKSITDAMREASLKVSPGSGETGGLSEVSGVRARRRLEREQREAEAATLRKVSELRVEWSGADHLLPREVANAVVAPRVLDVFGQRVVVAWKSQAEAVVFSRWEEHWRELWRGPVPSTAGVVAMPGSGRLTFAWPTGLHTTSGYGLQLVEVSTSTGREMYAGPGVSISPVSSTDLRFLAIILLGASAAVLLFVLKSEAADKAFHVPEGTVLAEGWRRGLATMVDLFVSLMIASEVRGIDLGEAMSLSGWMTGKGLPVMVVGLAIACASCTVFESLFGRSLGKMLAGCEVVDVSAAGASHSEEAGESLPRPSLVRSLIRNVIKWAFPPVGVFMVLDAAGRHPGDVFSKTAVVRWTPPMEDGDM